MANITRHPGYEQLFDDLLRGFFVRPVNLEGSGTPQIKLDVVENDTAFVVHAELPGVTKENIQVQIDGNQVSISAEVKNEKQLKEGDKVLREERYYGAVTRSFQLGADIDDTAAKAKYQDGILELTLPKRQAASTRKLVIE